jgi:dihydrofolate reductase
MTKMRKVVASMFMALDGVVENPMWSIKYWNDDIARFKQNELFSADAQLLGRVTYEGFAQAWPARKGQDEYADRFNAMPKYVVSTTLQSTDWENSYIISTNVAEAIAQLKQQDGQDILMFGSIKLVQSLMRDNLVDQFNILQYPIIIGQGQTFFGDFGAEYPLQLARSESIGSGAMLLVYEREAS